MGILQARILEWLAMPFSRGSADSGIEPRSPALLVDSLLSEPPEKPQLIISINFLTIYTCISFSTYKSAVLAIYLGFQGGTSGKEPNCQHRRCKGCRFDPWVLGREAPLEEGIVTHSSIFVWRIP